MQLRTGESGQTIRWEKSSKRDKERGGSFIPLCDPCPPLRFSLSHTHLKTPGCHCGHRHQDAIDRQDILFTTQRRTGVSLGLEVTQEAAVTPRSTTVGHYSAPANSPEPCPSKAPPHPSCLIIIDEGRRKQSWFQTLGGETQIHLK